MRDAKSTYLREQRDEALYKAYCKAITEHVFTCDTDACNWIRTHPAPRFYVTPEFCAILVSRLKKGVDCGLKGLRLKRANDMYNIYLALCERPEFAGKSMVSICNVVVESEAPEFYLERRAVADIIAKEKASNTKYMISRWVR